MQTTTTTSPLALPQGWAPSENSTAWVRYARRLRATGQPVTAYRLAAATTPAQRKLRKHLLALCPGATFVVVHHASGHAAGFATWAMAYAYTCTLGGAPLAPSVVASMGKQAGTLPSAPAMQ